MIILSNKWRNANFFNVSWLRSHLITWIITLISPALYQMSLHCICHSTTRHNRLQQEVLFFSECSSHWATIYNWTCDCSWITLELSLNVMCGSFRFRTTWNHSTDRYLCISQNYFLFRCWYSFDEIRFLLELCTANDTIHRTTFALSRGNRGPSQ